jgi:hypothetical protein
MKHHRVLFTVVLLILIGLFTASMMNAAAATPAKPAPVDPRKLIKSVSVPDSSVVIQFMRDKTTHAYKIDDITALKVNGVTGKVSDIKAGMVVDDFVERDDQTLDGLTVSGYGGDTSSAKPVAKPKPKPKPTTSTSG